MIRLAVWDGLDLRLREGIEMERRLAERHARLRARSSTHKNASGSPATV
jgi:hypothetical protein